MYKERNFAVAPSHRINCLARNCEETCPAMSHFKFEKHANRIQRIHCSEIRFNPRSSALPDCILFANFQINFST